MNDLEKQECYPLNEETVRALIACVKKLERELAQCYRLSGADPDGNEDWRLAKSAVVGMFARITYFILGFEVALFLGLALL